MFRKMVRVSALSFWVLSVFVIGVLIGFSVARGESAEVPLQTLYGIAVQSIDSVRPFYLHPGELDKCGAVETTGLTGIQKCEVAGSVIFTSPPYNYYVLDKLVILSSKREGGNTFRKFVFGGTWKLTVPETALVLESHLELIVYYYDQTPDDIQGWINIDRYNLKIPADFKKFNKRHAHRRKM